MGFSKVEEGFYIADERQLQEIERRKNADKIPLLEDENANLWYENMMDKSRIESAEQEIAMVWYEIALGGM